MTEPRKPNLQHSSMMPEPTQRAGVRVPVVGNTADPIPKRNAQLTAQVRTKKEKTILHNSTLKSVNEHTINHPHGMSGLKTRLAAVPILFNVYLLHWYEFGEVTGI